MLLFFLSNRSIYYRIILKSHHLKKGLYHSNSKIPVIIALVDKAIRDMFFISNKKSYMQIFKTPNLRYDELKIIKGFLGITCFSPRIHVNSFSRQVLIFFQTNYRYL